jgi:hypothetical protein
VHNGQLRSFDRPEVRQTSDRLQSTADALIETPIGVVLALVDRDA